MISELQLVKSVYLTAKNTIEEAVEKFLSTPYSSLPLIDNDGRFLGLIGLKDLVRQREKGQDCLLTSLSVSCVTLKLHSNPLELVWSGNNDIVPVLDDNECLHGFISREKLLNMACETYRIIGSELEQVLNSSYNGIIAINTEGIVIVYNNAAERILGYKKDMALGQHISALDPRMGLLEALERKEPSIGLKTEINGLTILTNRTLLMYGDKCVGAMGVFLDITDFESISRELRLNKADAKELNAIFESSYDGLYICDRNGRVIRVNNSWEKIAGFSRETVMGKTAHELVSEGYYDNSAAIMTLESKKTSTTMLKITSGPKKGQVIMATGTPILDEKGDLDLVVVNVRDITDLENLKVKLNETVQLSKRYASELEEIRRQQQKIEDLIPNSTSMKKVVELVTRVSQVDSTVLITGESGVGKELIAKKIHLLSKRKDKSLIKINCGAIPENLLESELFGYEGGAFTGARKEGKPGMFELASGGTLFLDEIGDLPLSLQVKLLRVLQEREIVRVGGISPIQVDTRIIAATNKDLSSMVKRGTFREDLFYRLNVVNIQIPPLRDRREDIVPLVGSLLHKLNRKYNQNKNLSQAVVEKLLEYNWPGNIRELENTLERLVVLVNEDDIFIRHLPDFLQSSEQKARVVTLNRVAPLKTAVEEVEYQLLKKVHQEYGSTRTMAKVLEVNQSTIVRKMKQFKMAENRDAEEHQDGAYVHLIRI